MINMKVSNPKATIKKTLMIAQLFDGFWERWIVHGVERDVINNVRNSIGNEDGWVKNFSHYGDIHSDMAQFLQNHGRNQEAEHHYRLSSLYYNLAHWIFPSRCDEKVQLYRKVKELFVKADQISSINCSYETIEVEGYDCCGRVRIPEQPKGAIIIINPIDSTKEELFTYEEQFIKSGFATFSFDGPGQGETLTLNVFKATKSRWNSFINQVISFAYETLPNISIHLFGTSSGAVWSVYGSNHPYVNGVAAVSPAVSSNTKLPDYFTERMSCVLEGNTTMLPNLSDLSNCGQVLVFHGNKDVMVSDKDIYQLYGKLPIPKDIVEFSEEGHCCNNKLYKVRELSMQWFLEKGVERNAF